MVDDTEFNALAVRLQLQEFHDITPDEAQNGKIGFEKFVDKLSECTCNNRFYKLVVMDIQMPIMDGYESSAKILSHMKSINREKDVTIVALTSYSSLAVI